MKLMTASFLAWIVFLFGLAHPLSAQEQEEVKNNSMMISQLIHLMHNKSLTGELEILDEQLDKVKKISQQHLAQFTEMSKANVEKEMMEAQNRAGGDTQKSKDEIKAIKEKYYSKVLEAQQKTLDELGKVLLPHQLKRLRQIGQQRFFKLLRNADYFGIPYAMSDELKIPRKQKRELKEITDEVRQKFYEDVRKLRKKSMKQILSKLTAKQRKEFEERIGDFYEMD